jgi:hypothetical protein
MTENKKERERERIEFPDNVDNLKAIKELQKTQGKMLAKIYRESEEEKANGGDTQHER